MNVYAESNFVLELSLRQEQSGSCESIVDLAESSKIKLVVPAYSFAEPHETFRRRHGERKRLKIDLDQQFFQIARTATFADSTAQAQSIATLLIQSADEETKTFNRLRQPLLKVVEVIPLDLAILKLAPTYEGLYDFSPQDSLVLASVLTHLDTAKPSQSCFLNRNSKDFDDPDIVKELAKRGCRMLPRFDDGLQFIQSCLP